VLHNQAGHARVAIAVVRCRAAVERNRARRRVRAALAGEGLEFPGDMVLSVPPEAATMPFGDLRNLVQAAVATAAASVNRP
jgi:ribonuclease P protein component